MTARRRFLGAGALAALVVAGLVAPAAAAPTSPDGAGPDGAGPDSAVAALAATPRGAVPAAAGDLVIAGRGFGHGIGLSQYGAKGRAEKGQSAQKIAAIYYPGTSPARLSDTRSIDVWLRGDTDGKLDVVAESGLRLRGSDPTKGTAGSLIALPTTVKSGTRTVTPARWRVSRLSSGWRLQASAGGKWTTVTSTAIARTLANAKRVTVSDSDLTVRNVVGSTANEYLGSLNADLTDPATRAVSVTLTSSYRSYLRSVVPAEMPSYWHAQALGAQAIAARTYASYEQSGGYRPWWWDTCDTTSCQVFKGAASYDLKGRRTATHTTAATDAAVKATAGLIRTYGGKPAFTQFSASNGGYSVAGSQPYLKAKPDPYDAFTWNLTVSKATLAAAYPSVGTVTSVSITRDGKGAYGGRATSVKLTGTGGTTTVSGDAFRIALGLRSTLFTVTVQR
ncbi:SpoIID/LytB domain-containing protein [Cellulomonas gelida]|uniref:Sporulation stage II protein D amidase enhancer LytB N-terminal domain-containing protein n=1 Tax=Cellulomonas gelida TaxID=1712 RepID=A0A4Y3KIP0_9CELL|nr:SpoIID/LytB domain-containing protein [Cellulomonas gelida]GEA83506.1 hypothetical protein CGE01nite_07570 [Cellulomonas gelida]GGL24406.1 hypothetical protein GCM10009774_13620 [Cellulomonas gelida]